MKLLLILNCVVLIHCHGGGGGRDEKKEVSAVVTYDRLALKLNDTKWTAGRQWYLVEGTYTHNVLPAWSNCLRGIDSVTVAVLGDGVNHAAEDLAKNYNEAASYNMVDDNADAKPAEESESWGTKAAAMIGMSANDKCGAGIAFDTSIAGIRYDYKDKAKFDENLAAAVTKNLDSVAVFVGALGSGLGFSGDKTTAMLNDLVTKGRSGKGSVLFWPSGDTQRNESCALDPLVNDLRTVSLASISKTGHPLVTSRKCGALLASAYSEDPGSSVPMNAPINEPVG